MTDRYTYEEQKLMATSGTIKLLNKSIDLLERTHKTMAAETAVLKAELDKLRADCPAVLSLQPSQAVQQAPTVAAEMVSPPDHEGIV